MGTTHSNIHKSMQLNIFVHTFPHMHRDKHTHRPTPNVAHICINMHGKDISLFKNICIQTDRWMDFTHHFNAY